MTPKQEEFVKTLFLDFYLHSIRLMRDHYGSDNFYSMSHNYSHPVRKISTLFISARKYLKLDYKEIHTLEIVNETITALENNFSDSKDKIPNYFPNPLPFLNWIDVIESVEGQFSSNNTEAMVFHYRSYIIYQKLWIEKFVKQNVLE